MLPDKLPGSHFYDLYSLVKYVNVLCCLLLEESDGMAG